MAARPASVCPHCGYDMAGLDTVVCPECGGDASEGIPPRHWAGSSQRTYVVGLALIGTLWGLLLAGPLIQYYRRGYTDPGSDGFMIVCTVMMGAHLITMVLCARRRRWFRAKSPMDAFFEVVILGFVELVFLVVLAMVL